MSIQTFEVCLSASLIIGAIVNAASGRKFLKDPLKSTTELGLPIDLANVPDTQRSVVVMLRLVGVLLIALALFYFVTAVNPLSQVLNVVLAVIARLLGVAFYAITIRSNAGPPRFKKLLALNLVLALSHLGLLIASHGQTALLNKWDESMRWINSLCRV